MGVGSHSIPPLGLFKNTGLGAPYLLNLGLLKKAPSNINNIAESIPIASWLNNIETGMDNAVSIKKIFINMLTPPNKTSRSLFQFLVIRTMFTFQLFQTIYVLTILIPLIGNYPHFTVILCVNGLTVILYKAS